VRGIVAVDLSDVLHHARVIQSLDDRSAAEFVKVSVDRFFVQNHERLHKILHGSNVIGLLLCAHLPVQTFTPDGKPRVATAVRWVVVALEPPATEGEADAILAFARRCEPGLLGN